MDTVRTVPCITMQTAADDLNISRTQLFQMLRDHGVFIDRLPREAWVRAGYFRVEIHERRNPNNDRIRHQYGIAMVTGLGLAWLKEFTHDPALATEALGRRNTGGSDARGQTSAGVSGPARVAATG